MSGHKERTQMMDESYLIKRLIALCKLNPRLADVILGDDKREALAAKN